MPKEVNLIAVIGRVLQQIARLHRGDAVIRDQTPQGACLVILVPKREETAVLDGHALIQAAQGVDVMEPRSAA